MAGRRCRRRWSRGCRICVAPQPCTTRCSAIRSPPLPACAPALVRPRCRRCCRHACCGPDSNGSRCRTVPGHPDVQQAGAGAGADSHRIWMGPRPPGGRPRAGRPAVRGQARHRRGRACRTGHGASSPRSPQPSPILRGVTTQLLIIDPQNDFCDLPRRCARRVRNRRCRWRALADLRRRRIHRRGGCAAGRDHGPLDSHQRLDIAHPGFGAPATQRRERRSRHHGGAAARRCLPPRDPSAPRPDADLPRRAGSARPLR